MCVRTAREAPTISRVETTTKREAEVAAVLKFSYKELCLVDLFPNGVLVEMATMHSAESRIPNNKKVGPQSVASERKQRYWIQKRMMYRDVVRETPVRVPEIL